MTKNNKFKPFKESKKTSQLGKYVTSSLLVISLVLNIYFIGDKYLYPSPISLFLDKIGIPQPKHRIAQILRSEGYNDIPNYKTMQEYEIKGMVESIKDPYSEFLNKEESQNLWNQLNQEYAGIGIRLDVKNQQIVIQDIFHNSPAQKAGLEEGDIIKSINSKQLTIPEDNLEKVLNQIQGPVNSTLKLEIIRKEKKFDFVISRQKIKAPESKLEIQDDIGIINIYTFGDSLNKEFDKIARKISAKKINKIILDLRGNTGGLVDSVSIIADYFFEKPEVLVYQKSQTQLIAIKTADNHDELIKKKIVILVDKYTASASEILAIALKEKQDAYIIGETTFGKGSVQSIYDFKDQTTLKLTIAKWLSPNKNSIDNVGIKPDLKIDSTKALDKAIEYLD
jgi:carboxyl-terminal processing protease